MVDQGELPAIKQLIDRGACRDDLAMIGGMPTITPVMWTSLATGAYASTHRDYRVFGNVNAKIEVSLYMHWILLYVKRESLWNCTAGSRF